MLHSKGETTANFYFVFSPSFIPAVPPAFGQHPFAGPLFVVSCVAGLLSLLRLSFPPAFGKHPFAVFLWLFCSGHFQWRSLLGCSFRLRYRRSFPGVRQASVRCILLFALLPRRSQRCCHRGCTHPFVLSCTVIPLYIFGCFIGVAPLDVHLASVGAASPLRPAGVLVSQPFGFTVFHCPPGVRHASVRPSSLGVFCRCGCSYACRVCV